MQEAYRDFLADRNPKSYAGYPVSPNELFSDSFSQAQIYGNGLGYILIVPDNAVRSCRILYSLYAVLAKDSVDREILADLTEACGGLSLLMRNICVSSTDRNGYTSLIENTDYLSGKCLDKNVMSQFSALSICLFYLALVLEIIGAAILATQLLSDRRKQRRQDIILGQIGMDGRPIQRLNRWQISLFFLLPLPPAILVSSCYILVCTEKMAGAVFLFPPFWGKYWMLSVLGISLLLFGLLYAVYYAAARISFHGKSDVRSGTMSFPG